MNHAPDKSLQATRDGGSSSASRFTLVGPARLSSGRSAFMSDDLSEYLRKNPTHLPLNRQALEIAPDYFRSTVSMLHGAFADGLPMAEYIPLLHLFRRQGWSDRGIAKAMQTCFEIEYLRALHDAGKTDGPDAPSDKIERLRQHLIAHGLDAWERENETNA